MISATQLSRSKREWDCSMRLRQDENDTNKSRLTLRLRLKMFYLPSSPLRHGSSDKMIKRLESSKVFPKKQNNITLSIFLNDSISVTKLSLWMIKLMIIFVDSQFPLVICVTYVFEIVLHSSEDNIFHPFAHQNKKLTICYIRAEPKTSHNHRFLLTNEKKAVHILN